MSTLDCPICFDSKPSLEITTLPCNCTACSDCLSDWITMKIQEQGRTVDQTINCIISTCKKPFPIHSVYSNILPSYQQKLDQALLQDYLSKDKNVRKCPKPGCTYAGIIDLTSRNCKEDISCQLCGTAWRDKSQLTWSQTLQNHFKRMSASKDEALSSLWKGWKTKKCPNCSVEIEKNQGCPHMTCSRCSHEFCWDCKSTYPKHNIPVHLARILIPSAICVGLTVFGFRKFCAIPTVQRVISRFIRPAANNVKSIVGKAAKGTFRFVLQNLPLIGLFGTLGSRGSANKNGFLMFTSVSLGLFCSLELHRQMLRTLCIDLAIVGVYWLKRYKRTRDLNRLADISENYYADPRGHYYLDPLGDDMLPPPQNDEFVQIDQIDSVAHARLADKMVRRNSAPDVLRKDLLELI